MNRPRWTGPAIDLPYPLVRAVVAAGMMTLPGCASSLEHALHADLRARSRQLGAHSVYALADRGASRSQSLDEPRNPNVAPPDGSLGSYLALALRHNPATRAAFARWRAATLQIAAARRLPEPTLTYGFFIRSVETRVGPQRHRFSLRQHIPWPTRLTDGADAASARARATQRAFENRVLDLRRRVADAYYRLWLVHETHRLQSEHDIVLEALAATVRGRVATGEATLAELNQIGLHIARHHDHREAHREAARAAGAALFALLGSPPPREPPPTSTAPQLAPLPAHALQAAALAHPRIDRHAWLARASGSEAAAHAADRFPRFTLGVDYIETGPATRPNGAPPIQGSGDDAVMASLGISLPLWFGDYDDAVAAAHAEEQAHLADRDARAAEALADLEASLAGVRDASRRVRLFRDTLIPQAQTTYESVLGSYRAGRATVATMLLAQRDLLDLSLSCAEARSRYARARARLEYVLGRELAVVPDPAEHTAAEERSND